MHNPTPPSTRPPPASCTKSMPLPAHNRFRAALTGPPGQPEGFPSCRSHEQRISFPAARRAGIPNGLLWILSIDVISHLGLRHRLAHQSSRSCAVSDENHKGACSLLIGKLIENFFRSSAVLPEILSELFLPVGQCAVSRRAKRNASSAKRVCACRKPGHPPPGSQCTPYARGFDASAR